MNNLLRQVEKNKGEKVLSVIEKWMKIYSLELKKMNGLYELYSKAIEDKVCDIENEDKLIEVIAEYVDVNSSDYPSKSFTEENLVEVNSDYYILTGKYLDKVNNLNVLEWLKISSREDLLSANIELLRKAKQNDINLSLGHCNYNGYEGVDIDENLIKVLDLYNIKYPNRLIELTKEPMADHIEEESVVLELDNQRYKVLSWIGNLELKGCYTTSNWIDFNSIKRI